MVRSLADRGPAGAPHSPAPVRHAGPPTIGPEYFDIPAEDAARLPGPQLGEIPPQGATPWGAPAPEPVAQADPVVQAEPVAEAESAVGMEPVVQPEAVVQEEPVAQAEPAVQVEPTVQPEPVVAPEPVVQAEPVGLPEAVVQAEPVAVPVPAAQVPGPAPEPEVLADAETVVPEPVAAVAPVAPAEPAAPVEPVTEPLAEAAAVQAVVVEAEASVAQEIPADAPAEPAVEQPFVPPVAETPQDPDVAARTAAPALPAQVPVPVPAEGTVQTASHLAPEPEAPTAPVEVAQQETAEAAAQPEPPVVAPAAPVVVEPEAALTVPEPVAAEAPEAPDSLEAPAPVTIQAETPAPEPVAVPRAEAPAEPGTGTGPEIIETPEAGAPEAEAPVPSSDEVPASAPAPGYGDVEREAVLRVMRERRDIRNGFRSDPIPHEILLRVLEAAHTAPSVGHSQPWDFVVIRSAETRRSMHELAQRQREAYAKSLPKARAKQFKELKIEAILDTPVNIVVTADPTRGGRHTLGRHTQPQMAPYSSALAVENLWLAARAEGLGVGWVSFFDEREMVRALGLPEHLEVVAYLCVGYVDEFPDEPELMQAGWSKRRPLSWVVHEETYGRRALPGEAPHDLLQETIANIRPLDAKALGEAWERQKRMTKPAGALGMLEIISAQLSGLSRMCPPPIPEPAAVAVFAGDHGVHAQGVTAWPQEVTGQMVANFLGGGAVCNAFAAQVGAEVCVVDVGVASELPATPGLLPRKVRAGTADFTTGPALTREEVLAAIEVGIETARDLVAAGNKGLLTGEMGIANTTASAALICVYTGMDPAEVTGRGTGINDEMHARKVDVVRRGLELHRPDPADPIGVLAAVGGLEHAAMAGFLLGGASLRTPVILDGVSAGAAALVARAIAPEALAACIAGHRSAEPGHVAALNKLGLRPLVDLDLRLGEGTGALLALPIVQSAARAMHDVATFDSAGVTEK